MGNKFECQGLALKQFRKESGLTLSDVTDRLHHAPMWLSDIENGKKNIFFKDAKALCMIYGRTLDELSALVDKYERGEDMNKFEYQGQALKELRNKANYTMLEVAERRGKTKSWLSEIENGRKNVYFEDAKWLCNLYGVSLQYLADLIDQYQK